MDTLKWVLVLGHIGGAILGALGTSVAGILFLHFLKDLRLSAKDIVQMKRINPITWIGTFIFISSSLGLFLMEGETPYPNEVTLVILIAIILANGVFFSFWLQPNLNLMAFNYQVLRGRQDNMRLWRRLTYASGCVSLVTWYTLLGLAFFDFQAFNKPGFIGLYIALLVISLIISQVMERFIFHVHLEKKRPSLR